MPRKKFECDPTRPYHLAARSNNKDWFALPIENVWEIVTNYLHFVHHAFDVQTHAFVLMHNHFHLIASFPNANLSAAMEYFMRQTSRSIASEGNRINHVFGTRIFRSRLTSQHYYLNAYKYLLQNPVRAELCKTVESYQFSSLHGSLGQSKTIIPTVSDALLFDDVERSLRWLNELPDPEDVEAVRLALRRADFKLPRCSKTKRAHALESRLL